MENRQDAEFMTFYELTEDELMEMGENKKSIFEQKQKRLGALIERFIEFKEESFDDNDLLIEYNGSKEDLTIPDGITRICTGAFKYNRSLESAVIPASVTSIGDYAFSECSSLRSVVIPNSVTDIGHDAFFGCDKLTIKCPANSYAEIYAKENWIACETI